MARLESDKASLRVGGSDPERRSRGLWIASLTLAMTGLPAQRDMKRRSEPGHQRVRNLEIGVDVLHVVVFVEKIEQLEEFFASLVVH